MLNFNLFSNNTLNTDKIIYLDIDGVFHAPYDQGTIGNEWLKKPIEFLNKLIKETGAKVIITTYRTHYVGFHKVLHDLQDSGLEAAIIDYVCYPKTGINLEVFIDEKNTRIGNHISINFSKGLNNYIVIDDYNLFEDDYPIIKERFIKTNPEKGFSKENYDKAIQLLS